MIKKFQVYSLITVALLYAVTAPIFYANLDVFWIIIVILAIFTLFAKNWVDLILLVILAGNMYLHIVLYPFLDDTRHIVQTTAFTALTFLQITLIIGPLARINKRFSRLFRHRRHVGVATFLLAFIHANFVIAKYYEFNPELIYSISANYFGSSALIILSALAFTSTNYFQTKLPAKYYNIIHTGLLIFYISYTLGMSAVGILDFEAFHFIIFILFVIFWILIAPWSLPKRLFIRVNAWKQLHYLVYLAYIAIIIHAWKGYFQLQELYMQLTFWLPFIIVVVIHSYGWLIRYKKLNTQASEIPTSNTE